MSEYWTLDYESPISKETLRDADRDTQLEVIENWFRRNFEDPAQRTPYESAEGGYIWIWGGPFTADEVLQEEFFEVVPEDVIDALIEKLQGEFVEWAPTSEHKYYGDRMVEDIAGISEFHQYFLAAISSIEVLLEVTVEGVAAYYLWKLLYANAITALETYLSDAFINTIVNNRKYLRRFVETFKDFEKEKISLSCVLKEADAIRDWVLGELAKISWPSLDRVRPVYKATLGVEFSDDLGGLF
jgi:hypothetical protein